MSADPARRSAYAAAWDKMAAAQETAGEIAIPLTYLERGRAFDSTLFSVARTLVRLADESAKPNAERLREYGDAGRTSLEFRLFSDAPIYPEFEKAKLAHSLATWQNMMPESPLVEKVLKGRTPQEAADALVEGTKLADVATRKALAEGGKSAIAASDDPMIELAKIVDAAVARGSQEARGRRGRRREFQLRVDRQGDLRGPGGRGLSGRDLHAAAGVRHGEAL